MKQEVLSVKQFKGQIATGKLSVAQVVLNIDAHIRANELDGRKTSQGIRLFFQELTGIDIRKRKTGVVLDREVFMAACERSSTEQLQNRLLVTKSPIERDIIITVQDQKIAQESDLLTVTGDDQSIVQALIQTRDPLIIQQGINTMKLIVDQLEKHLKHNFE